MSTTNGNTRTTTTITKIALPLEATRMAWKSLADAQATYSDDEILEIVQRYLDHATHQKNYHATRLLKMKADAARSKALEVRLNEFAKAAGLSLAEYLETEEQNATDITSGK